MFETSVLYKLQLIYSRKGLASFMYNLQGMLLNHLKSLGALTFRPWKLATIGDSIQRLLL